MAIFNSNQIKGLILDMDGVLWRGSQAIGDLAANFTRIQELGLQVVLASNNSTSTVETFVNKVNNLGGNISKHQVISSSVVAAEYLQGQFPEGGPVYAVGEGGMLEILAAAGFIHTENHQPLAVVVGLDRHIDYEKIKRAALYIRQGAKFVATNPDRTYPAPEGLFPGAGAIVAAVEAASEVSPIYVGKPETRIFEVCLKRMGLSAGQVMVVGDRLETDIACGQKLGMKTALVLSGVTTREQADAWKPPIDWIGADLATLLFNVFE
jgi:4-nitrophenyl phosphatase